MKSIQYILFCSLHIFLINTFLQAQDRLTGRTFATRSVVMAQHGMACTSQPLATETAIDVLKNGGNAIDAAIAANAVLGVTDPEMNGIGGDLFAIVYDAKTKKLYGLNASGRSPYALTLDILKKGGEQIFLSVDLCLFRCRVVWMAGFNCMVNSESCP